MKFKKTYKIFETGYQRNIYYYINNKRVSGFEFYDTEYACQKSGMRYNSSVLHTDNKTGRTISIYYYD